MRSVDPEVPSSSAEPSVLRLLRPGPGATAALAAAIAAATALPLAMPQLTRRFVDDAAGGAGLRHLTLLALGYLALAVAGQAARMATAWLAGRLAWDGTNRLRERLAGHALGLDLSFHGRHTPGELIERVDGDVVAVADFVVAFLLDVVASVLLLSGVVVVVLAMDWRIGAVLLVYCLLVGYGMARAQRLAVPSAARSRAASATLFGTLEERLAGAEDLRANGAGEHTVRRFHQVSAALFRAEHRDARIGTMLLAGTSVAFAAGTAIMLSLAAWVMETGALTAGTAVLLFQYTLMVRAPFERLIGQIRQYQAALAGLARIAALLAERPALTPGTRPLPAAGALALRVENVAFSYPDDDEQVLSGIDVTLAPGETLGLVGRTGSGKTTLARLVLRLHDPVEGAVRVGGVDLRAADPRSLRARVAVVTQDVQLFTASVRDNLTLFRPSPGDARLMEVLDEVGLGTWAAGLPDGLDTVLDAGSGSVSAGQAQLLAFARAFLTDPGLVVLDEASSRLDPATERRIEDGIGRLLDGRTGVIIAHRLSSLSRVDKIAVLDRGKIVEYGRRDELAADPDSRFGRLLDLAGVGR
ncbi:ABC transporter, ATP-binding/permease protein [[Actinomadura] parvosata subsp. kistnae]|uniref:ABC transporter ATP-binding protein n=1 Tax=[Actinomadura] parvosata subsp. kistnae TaxID=1909395 RepID=A0A1U9ZSY9_9ACTN|nr:ABC transporter ATP-binding protein [Nonomuraea sp. ATCC 55076]AQZ61080.1 ABC transporter ATP-binding protein [Nonomuraea sp. ATCC 55076]SPL87549.1 ABC transporter, ATP-binding/permease protein [Actinomadura parvosata subsp. kistnae]